MTFPDIPQQPAALPSRRGRALPDLQVLETFVTVCEAGSMALAAQRLGISQSAVSQMMKVLEGEYGVQLLDRDVRPARPTRAGNILLTAANDMLSDARRVAEELRRSVRQDHAHLRLGCVDSFAATVGPSLVRALSGSARQLQLWSGLTPGLSVQLRDRELDIVICTEAPAPDSRIAHRLLCSEGWVAVFPRHVSPAPIAEARELRDRTEGLPLIRYTQRSVIGQQVERFVRHIGLEAPRRFEFDATDPMLSLVAAGLGWAISTPLCLWQSRAWLDDVVLLPIPAARLGQRDFFLLYREAEWSGMAAELARLTQAVLQTETVPALRACMPALPPDAVWLADLSSPTPENPRTHEA